ncbi:hypothetical protein NC651_001312 [Populus alba x Populus x berolinensis]|nr:hypothetical protein NC651_001312 [Populus alba x Populus x berolinensis]
MRGSDDQLQDAFDLKNEQEGIVWSTNNEVLLYGSLLSSLHQVALSKDPSGSVVGQLLGIFSLVKNKKARLSPVMPFPSMLSNNGQNHFLCYKFKIHTGARRRRNGAGRIMDPCFYRARAIENNSNPFL